MKTHAHNHIPRHTETEGTRLNNLSLQKKGKKRQSTVVLHSCHNQSIMCSIRILFGYSSSSPLSLLLWCWLFYSPSLAHGNVCGARKITDTPREVSQLQILVSQKCAFKRRGMLVAACVCVCVCVCLWWRWWWTGGGMHAHECVCARQLHGAPGTGLCRLGLLNPQLISGEWKESTQMAVNVQKSRLRETCQLRFKFLLLVSVTLQYSSDICLFSPKSTKTQKPGDIWKCVF